MKNNSARFSNETFKGICVLCACFYMLLFTVTICAQQFPPFSFTTGTALTNTNGNWVTFNPAEPNNRELLETRIFTMPAKGSGVKAVEFKLRGADGGTARYQNGAFIFNGFGGEASTVSYTLDLQNRWSWPFFITFGKHGESVSTHNGYCTAGGGGSTGMGWLNGITNVLAIDKVWGGNILNGRLVAGAAGGGGGWASYISGLNGRGGNVLPSMNDGMKTAKLITTTCQDATLHMFAGASLFYKIPFSEGIDQLGFNAVSTANREVINWGLGSALLQGNSTVLQKFTYGQNGGVPYSRIDFVNGNTLAGTLSDGLFIQFGSCDPVGIQKNGGKGGSGFRGGGAGGAGLNKQRFDGFVNNFNLPGGGGGGTVKSDFNDIITDLFTGVPGVEEGGWGGVSQISPNAQNPVITNGGNTSTPQSGYFMYRTIADDIPPVLNVSNVTLTIGYGTFGFPNNSATLTRAALGNGSTDNDSIKTFTFSKSLFTCADVGTTQPVTVTATDFAGNSTSAVILVTVQDTTAPVRIFEQSQNPFDPNSVNPNLIDVTNGAYTLTAANFPQASGGCNTNITIHFPATTFNCAQAGTQQAVSFYYTNSAGRTSPTYTKTFTVSKTAYPIIYVDATATGANNGSSWANAFTRLQDALNFGCPESRDIYIAQGTYYPDRGNNITLGNRDASFNIAEGYKLYGGFPAGGSVFSNRNPSTNPTILSGNIGNLAIATDNSYHVVTINGNNTQLDGLSIQEGYANDSPTSGGGGVYLQQQGTLSVMHNVTLRQCKLLNNFGNAGGAVYLSFANNVTVNRNRFFNCIFQNNSTLGNGGAVRIKGSLPSPATQSEFTQCIIGKNTAAQGGGIYLEPSVIGNIVNCTFSRNKASAAGGALYNNLITNIRNSILYFDSVGTTPNEVSNNGTINVFFSNLQGSGGSSNWNSAFGTNQGNNIDVNPQFLAGSLLEITPASLCRNAGNKNFISEQFDIRGTTRVLQDTVDIGAYESNPVVYVAWDAPNGGNGQSWATAYNNLQDGLDDAGLSGFQKDVWIKGGTYKPTRATNGANGGRQNTFFVRASNGVYGGFAGNETQLTQRNVSANPTILSGDIGTANDASDNTYHVITLNGRSPRLDGLIIENGNANDAGNLNNRVGAGIYDPGIFAQPNPVVFNCVLRNNSATGNGGAVFVSNTSTNYTMDFVQTIFYGNSALRGGAVYVQKGGSNNIDVKARFYNCTAINNAAGAFNAAGFAESFVVPPVVGTATLELNNCLVLNNTTQNIDGSVVNSNSFIGTNNNDLVNINSPAGVDGLLMTSDDGYRLQPSSAAINFGSNALIHADIKKDITNGERILQLQVDAGAYENIGCLGTAKLYVDANVDTLNGNGLSWATAFRHLNDALKMSNVCPLVDSILIAEGTYYPPGDISSTVSTDMAFEISRPVKLLGGYPSGGGVRNVLQHPVVLSGDINTESVTDNATHIMLVATSLADTTLVDGITFTKGYAAVGGNYLFNGKNFLRNKGGAISAHTSLLHVNNCRFINNRGGTQSGAVHINGGRFISTRSLYDGNTAGSGGAVCAEALTDTLRLVGNVWVRNTTNNGVGGAVFGTFPSVNSFTDIRENVFAFNTASSSGGSVYIGNGNYRVVNNTFYKNTSGNSAGGFYAQSGSSASLVANNIFTQNTDAANDGDVVYPAVVTTAKNYLTVLPSFIDTLNPMGADGVWMTADDGLKMKPTSSLLNGGENTILNSVTDITGAPRTQYGVVDPGAYENEMVVTRWYVSAAQDSVTPDGASWATAFPKFQDGVIAAKAGDSVWVAQGVYAPELAGTSFTLKNKVKVLGGFEGTEQQFSQRNLGNGWNAVLEGNNAVVLQNDSTDNSTLLDGFVIQNGNALGNGGGVRNTSSAARFSNLIFTRNNANHGGAIANIQSTIQLSNVVFAHNTAVAKGGAVYDSVSTTDITNATFYGNTAQDGAALAAVGNSFETIGNSIFQANNPNEFYYDFSFSNINYSLLQTENNGQGNITGIEPFFSNENNVAGFDGKWFTADDGLTATYRSVFVNNGNNALSSAILTDITNAGRTQNGTVDMGAYESAAFNFCDSAAATGSNKLYVNINLPGSGDGSSWSKAFRTLNEALDIANYCTSVDTILIAGGTYYPTGYQANENRRASFTLLRSGIHLLGGYSGNDTVARNPGKFNTVLSGNINDATTANDNSYNVLTLKNVGSNCSIDGLIIADGRADSTAAPFNTGGGILNQASGTGKVGNPTISNCVFYNHAARQGGALFNNGSLNGEANATVINCVFANDTAFLDGGAVYNNGSTGTSSGTFINCSFGNNYAAGSGAAVCNQGSGGNNQSSFTNCVFYNNIAATGAVNVHEVYNINSNASAAYSMFQNGLPALMQNGGNNLSGNPVFVDDIIVKGNDNVWMTYDDGLALQVSSAAVKTGSNVGAPAKDITGTVRGTLPDRGAYQNTCTAVNFTLNQNASGCDSVYSPSFRKVWYSSGTYLDTIFSPIGCDSFITVNLTLGQSKAITLTPVSCGSYISPTGKVYDTTGAYTDTIQTISGCDSIFIIQLTVKPIPQPTIVPNGNVLSTQTFASYQWLWNNVPVNGATGQTYTVTQNGNYSVIVTNADACSDTSAAVNVTGLSVADWNNEASVWLYPNPNNGTFTIAFSDNAEKEIVVTDTKGAMVMSRETVQSEKHFMLPSLSEGIYFLHIRKGEMFQTLRFAVLK